MTSSKERINIHIFLAVNETPADEYVTNVTHWFSYRISHSINNIPPYSDICAGEPETPTLRVFVATSAQENNKTVP